MAVKKLNYLLDVGSKNYSNLLLDASHRVEPVNAVVVCAVNEQANRVAFFFPAFFNASGVKGGDEGFPVCVMHHRWESQSLLLLSAWEHLLCMG